MVKVNNQSEKVSGKQFRYYLHQKQVKITCILFNLSPLIKYLNGKAINEKLSSPLIMGYQHEKLTKCQCKRHCNHQEA